jgi:hypothetical protein
MIQRLPIPSTAWATFFEKSFQEHAGSYPHFPRGAHASPYAFGKACGAITCGECIPAPASPNVSNVTLSQPGFSTLHPDKILLRAGTPRIVG